MGLWDEQDGFFYDVLQLSATAQTYAAAGAVRWWGCCRCAQRQLWVQRRCPGSTTSRPRFGWFIENKPQYRTVVGETARFATGSVGRLLSIVDGDRLVRILDHDALRGGVPLAATGCAPCRSGHRDEPFSIDLGGRTYTVDYEPGESTIHREVCRYA